MKPVDLKELLEAGCHFGHKTNKWNPKAATFIYKAVGDTHIIDLIKTKEGLEQAASLIFETAKKGGTVLFIGTKRQASAIVKEAGERAGAPYFSSRWIGGFITNWEEVRKNIDKLSALRKELKDEMTNVRYTKLERLLKQREIGKLESIYGGVTALEKRPNVVFVVDIRKEEIALIEADQYNIPTIGIVDTNSDPTKVRYTIPANDDAVGSITYIVNYVTQAYKEGMEAGKKMREEAAKKAEEQRIKAEKDQKAKEEKEQRAMSNEQEKMKQAAETKKEEKAKEMKPVKASKPKETVKASSKSKT